MLIVEDGSIMDKANSYVTVDEFKEFVQSRQEVVYDDVVIERALIMATDYIESMYGLNYVGDVIDQRQSLGFPRTTFGKVIPERFKKCFMFISKAVVDGAVLYMTTTPLPIAGNLKAYTDKLAAMLTSYEFFQSSTGLSLENLVMKHPYVESMINEFTHVSSNKSFKFGKW